MSVPLPQRVQLTQGVERAWARAWALAGPVVAVWVVYLAAVVFAAHAMAFNRPFDGQSLWIGIALAAGWCCAGGIATVAFSALAIQLGGRVFGVFLGAFTAVACVGPQIASLAKVALVGQHLSATDLGFLARNTAVLADRTAVIVVVAVSVCVAALTQTLRWWRRRSQPSESPAKIQRGLLIGVLLGVIIALFWPRAEEFSRSYLPEIAWFAPPDARDPYTRHKRLDLRDEEICGAPIGSWQAPVGWTAADHPHVIVIMIDGVRHQHLGVGGGPAGVTPNIDVLAAQARVYERAYTTATHSDYAQTSFLSGLHPRKFRGHDYFVKPYPRTLIWDVLKPLGYATSVFSTHNENWGDMLRFLKTPNVDVFRHAPDWPNAPTRGHGSDTAVPESLAVDAWQRWFRSTAGPKFSYLNFQVTHFPYTLPPGAAAPFQPATADFGVSFVRYPRAGVPVMKNRFFNALHHADRWVGEVVNVLKAQKQWENTIVFVASDHGEAFYEHDQPTHGTSLYEEQIQSVWLARVPGVAPSIVKQPVSLVAAMPTLLTMLGLGTHPNMQSRLDVAPAHDKRDLAFFTIQGLASMDGVTDGKYKFIRDIGNRRSACFALQSDPNETRNVAASDPNCRAYSAILDAFLDRQLAYYDRQLWNQGCYPASTL